MIKRILFIFGLLLIASSAHAQFAIFQAASPVVGINITQAPYSATCNGVADDSAAFEAFRLANQTTAAVVQYIPPGSVCCITSQASANGALWRGIKNLTVNASGATMQAACGGVSSGIEWADNKAIQNSSTTWALFQTVSAGASCVTLVTAGQTSRFAVDSWVLATNIDVQGPGSDPPNAAVFEFLKVLSSGGGQVCFTTNLTNSYLSTYPNYDSTGCSSGSTCGGPATLYALDPDWDQTIVVNGLTYNEGAHFTGSIAGNTLTVTAISDGSIGTSAAIGGTGVAFATITALGTGTGGTGTYTISGAPQTVSSRSMSSSAGFSIATALSITLNSVTMIGGGCGLPTITRSFTANNNIGAGCSIEVDKQNANVVYSGGNIRNLVFQSMSNNVTLSGGIALNNLNGAPGVLSGNGITSAFFTFGVAAYGAASSASCTNCVISAFSRGAYHNPVSLYSISGGVISIGGNEVLPWCVPGKTMILGGRLAYEGEFTITGLSKTGDTTNCATAIASASWPSLPVGGGGLGFGPDPAPSIFFSGSTGSADAVDFSNSCAQNQPLYTCTDRVYTCAANMANVPGSLDINVDDPGGGPIIWGSPTTITVNVSTPDTSATGSLPWEFLGQFGTGYVANDRTLKFIDPVVSLKTAGVRVITASDTTCSNGGSQCTGDTLVDTSDVLTFGDTVRPQPPSAPNVAGTCPVARVTIQAARKTIIN